MWRIIRSGARIVVARRALIFGYLAAYPGGEAAIVHEALESGEYDMALQIGRDYLFRVRPKPPSG
jgi:hypothetical protein